MSRLFIAIDLPDPIKTATANICFGVQGAKWVPVDQLHLTLRFVGEADNETYVSIRHALSEVQMSAFTIDISGVGFFPPRGKPRVLWLGIVQNESLTELKNKIEEAVVNAGIAPEERKFHPHITLARLKERTTAKDIIPFLSSNNLFSFKEVPVDSFYLYSSILKPQGAIHSREATYELTNAGFY